jgi:parallel beta-helix repeat protein
MRHELIVKSIIFGIVVLFIGVGIASAHTVESSNPQPMTRGNILYVGGSGPGNYTTIQAAINNATNGNIIFVYNKTYNENIDTKLKKITLIGENRDITIINGQTTVPTVRIGSSDVTITRFTIIGISPGMVVQVASLSQNVFITNNLIKNGGYGISLLPTTSKITITNNTIVNHTFIGVQLQTSNYNVIRGNNIENNGGQGIEFSFNSNHNSILNNSIVSNIKEAILIEGVGSTVNTIMGNNISKNHVGIRFSSASSNTIKNNNIQDSAMEGILLQTSSDNVIEMNNLIQNIRQATFKISSRNTWNANYWSNWIGFKLTQPGFQKFPKVIFGVMGINFDWHPATQPYNISSFV